MTEKQQAAALALARIPAVAAEIQNRHTVGVSIPGPALVPNIADETGAVEGVLHRVLERLVGEPVEVAQSMLTSGARGWRCAACSNARGGWLPAATRLDAIVAAILAHGAPVEVG